jgi:Ca2+-transporting ATPase
VDIARLRRDHPTVAERPFDSAWKFARVTVDEQGRRVSYLKGAPEILFGRCALSNEDRESWVEKADAYAREGFRVLALAWGEGETEEHLSLLGLVLFWDPPRPEVPDAVATARAAGIRVVMITGDHPATALAVAHLIGIPGVRVLTGEDLDEYRDGALSEALHDVNVFARVRPEQKLQLVELLQARGEIVAMTGDGVNDAPALKRADVGVAMGQRGSDVSREVADLVLLDDNFTTIVGAVEEGRGIYENIQKFLRFLFSTNLSEVLLIAIGAVLAFGLDLRDAAGALMLPLTAVQILWINLLTDGIPALALAFDRTPGVMRQRPRPPSSPLLDGPSVRFVVGVGSMKAALALAVLGALPLLGYSLDATRAATFHFMAVGQLFLVYPSRHTWMRPQANPYLHAAVIAGVGIQLAAASLPFTAALLGDAAIPVELWGVVFGGALLAWGLAEGCSRFVWRQRAGVETADR